MWTKRGNTHTDEEYTGNIDFVRQVILGDEKVREVKERKWEMIQQEYPHSTTKKFDEFWNWLWSSWVQEKKKLATHKVKEMRRKNKLKEKKASSQPSDDSAVRPSIPTTAPNNRIMPLHDSTSSPQMPLSGSTFDNHNDEIIVETSPKPRATTPTTASICPLLPLNSITTPKSTPAATLGSEESSSITS
jgi:hypothetical protein